MSPILPKLRDLVAAERREVVIMENIESTDGNANGGSVIGGNQSGTGSNTETNTGGNGGTINGDGTGNANGGIVIGGNQSGTGSNTETNTGGNGGTINGDDTGNANGGTVIGGNQSGGGNNTETNIGGNGGTVATGNANGGTGANQGEGGNNAGASLAKNGGTINGDGTPTTIANMNSGSTVLQTSKMNPPSSPPPFTSVPSPSISARPPFISTSTPFTSAKLIPNSLSQPSTSISIASNTPSSPSFTPLPPLRNSSRNALIGGVVGGLTGLLILSALLVYYFIRRFRSSKKNPLDNIIAFDASQFRNTEPGFLTDTKLKSSSRALLPNAPSITSQPSPSRGSSDSLAVYPNSMDAPEAQRNTREFVNASSPDNTLFLPRDLTEDQLTSRPSQPLQQGLSRSISILSDNPTNLNPLLREIFNGRSGDGNVPSNIQIFLVNEPSNVEELVTTSDGRGASRNINLPPPNYESE
ncbi:hypothetical protein Clacol_001988 [Clathrus columnatus]|uniref:Uncharacterized protein n=1 Tax=Clathrus columnatus TaxID=1419009 RepID=A0AAV5A543_9AGAM|nr:hypothetical protein Clacol_001988 [Clathrus columnatus]